MSPTYALEIQTPEYGFGFDGILRYRAADLVGILNGIDYDQWDPALLGTLRWALSIYRDRDLWRRIQPGRECSRISPGTPRREYVKVYERAAWQRVVGRKVVGSGQ